MRASQVRPGNPSVVHHLVVFVIPPGRTRTRRKIDFLAAYAPGMPPRILPDGAAKLVPAGSKLMFQVHYTPRGTPQTDRSEIGLVFADPKTIRKEMTAIAAINMDLRIPAGAADFAVEAEHRFDQDTLLYSLLPHMHLRGKSFRFEAVYPDGRREVLLDVPRYEFEWQNVYVLSEPKLMPEGTVLRCLARYDNSAGQPVEPRPEPNGHLGRANARRDARRLRRGRPGRPGPEPGRAREPQARRRPLRGHLPLPPPAGTKAVYLAGTFNDWKPADLKMDGPDASGSFEHKQTLDAGTHEYKFVLEGTNWRHDPGNRRQAGIYHNSVLELAAAKTR